MTTLIDSRIRIVRQAAVSGFHNRGRRSVDVWQALCWLTRMSTGPSWVAAMSGIAGRSSSTASPDPRIEGLGCRNRPQSGSSASAAALKASSSPGLRIPRSTISSFSPANSRRTIGGIRQYSNAVVSQIVMSMPQECTKHQAELPQILGDSFMYLADVTRCVRVHAGKTPSWLLAAQKKYVRLRFNFCVTNVLCDAFIKHLVDKSLLIDGDGMRDCAQIKTQTCGVFGRRRASVCAADAYNPLEMLVTRQFW